MLKLNAIGHLGKDCQTKLVNGKSVINFTMAHSEKFKDANGELKEKTIWLDCSYWTEKTAVTTYLKKGQLIYAEGIPDIKNYTKNDGKPASSFTLRVLGIQLLGSGNRNDQNQESLEQSSDVSGELETADLPF